MRTPKDGSVHLVQLQFSFSNPGIIPVSVRRLKRETDEELTTRKSRLSGIQIIEPTASCSIVEFPMELEKIGYEMVDAFYKERIETKTKRTYHMVRFVFACREHVWISDDFRNVRGAIRADLQNICMTAMWRVRAYSNPYYMDDEDSEERAISINMEAREPLYLPNGQPVVIWLKDENGSRLGNAPVPISPKYHLHISIDNVIELLPAQAKVPTS